MWGEKGVTPSGTDQNSPSSFLFSSCFWMSGDTSSHSLVLEQSQAAEQEPHRVRRHLFLPRRLLSPECLPTGGSGLDREPRGVGLSLAYQPVPLWHCLACGSVCCVLCPSNEGAGQGHLLVTSGSIPLIPAPGFLDPNQCFCPAPVEDLGREGVKPRAEGLGVLLLCVWGQGLGSGHVLSDSHRSGGQSLSKRDPSPASPGSSTPTHFHW